MQSLVLSALFFMSLGHIEARARCKGCTISKDGFVKRFVFGDGCRKSDDQADQIKNNQYAKFICNKGKEVAYGKCTECHIEFPVDGPEGNEAPCTFPNSRKAMKAETNGWVQRQNNCDATKAYVTGEFHSWGCKVDLRNGKVLEIGDKITIDCKDSKKGRSLGHMYRMAKQVECRKCMGIDF